MVTRSTAFAQNEHYHVYNRGNSKQNIFRHHSDYQRFFNLLYLANTTVNINTRNILRNKNEVFSVELGNKLVNVHAVCLMPNHYHLLLSPLTDKGISTFMLKLGTGYSMYFNTKYERTGSLFEGRYQAKHADNDEYVKYLFSYIHLNPVAQNEASTDKNFAEAMNYPYSSLAYYLDHTPPRAALGVEKIIHPELLNLYLPDRTAIAKEMYDWLDFDPVIHL